jgi:L-threonylcarbamoyladenylate synthase
MKTEIISSKDSKAVKHAVDVFECGGLVAFPTDTVYGLAAPVFNVDSIERLYIVKGRNHSKAIALLIGNIDQLKSIADMITRIAWNLASAFWPGPLTLVLKRHRNIPEILSPQKTIGVRIPDHPDALSLINQTGPLAVTSANLSGRQSPITAEEVKSQLNQKIHLIIDGGITPGGIPSTVIDCTTEDVVLLREGPISFEVIKSTIKKE